MSAGSSWCNRWPIDDPALSLAGFDYRCHWPPGVRSGPFPHGFPPPALALSIQNHDRPALRHLRHHPLRNGPITRALAPGLPLASGGGPTDPGCATPDCLGPVAGLAGQALAETARFPRRAPRRSWPLPGNLGDASSARDLGSGTELSSILLASSRDAPQISPRLAYRQRRYREGRTRRATRFVVQGA